MTNVILNYEKEISLINGEIKIINIGDEFPASSGKRPFRIVDVFRAKDNNSRWSIIYEKIQEQIEKIGMYSTHHKGELIFVVQFTDGDNQLYAYTYESLKFRLNL